ncbi:MAG: 60S ribosomal export protein NMD3 [Methanomicrobium sp.]|nr:60S ribosomal export protein NMD3 [Methanomicrobium sp.]
MNIRQNICPKCGGPSDGGLCNKCKAGAVEWITHDARVPCVQCPTCGSLKHQNTWSDCALDREKLIEDIALNSIHVHEDVHALSIAMKHHDPSPNRTSVKVNVQGKIYGVPVEKDVNVLILWSREQCDRCSRYAGGYYAGTIQLRADGRKPDEYERNSAVDIAHRVEDEVQKHGERLSFITDVEENKDGMDIIISSHNLGELVSKALTKELGGKITRHPKLIGEKNGKQVYRITYLVRLPKYQKGDVFENNGRYYEIRGTEGNLVQYFDLMDGTTKISKDEPEGRKIGNVADSEHSTVIYINGDTAAILDPKTYENIEVIIYPWHEIYAGDKVRFLRDTNKERIIFVG